MNQEAEFLIVGAGVSGLACAQVLGQGKARVVVLERSSRVGGRCSSKPLVDDQGPLVDYGPFFAHGKSEGFKNLVLAASKGQFLEGWPRWVEGSGMPCQPAAFSPGAWRMGLPGGINQIPQFMAQSLPGSVEILLKTEVVSISQVDRGWKLGTSDGREFVTKNLILALALEQSKDLLKSLASHPALATLGLFASVPSLTVMAAYDQGVHFDAIPWDMWYPSQGGPILAVSNEWSKRPQSNGQGALGALVIQARPGWSSSHMEIEKDLWSRQLLHGLAEHLGSWVLEPRSMEAHRWKYGRILPGDELANPLLFAESGQGTLGVVGDLYWTGGGLEAAWESGRTLGARILGKSKV